MTKSTDILVSKSDHAKTRVVETDLGDLGKGKVLLRVEKFALTANNVTYAVFGDQMAYWNFFPAEDGWGRVPVWGFATVEASNNDEIAVGQRFYGYLPMSTHLVVEPGRESGGQFQDVTDYRQAMSTVYNMYRTAAAPSEGEDYRPLFEPLFTTSFLIEDFMRREAFYGAGTLLITSASSKTAMALAQVARERSPDVKRIGLTSSGNIDFVKALGLYDETVAYGDIASLETAKTAVAVDFAGNADTLSAIHHHYGDALKYSCLVGATHWQARGLGGEMPGPAPMLFFAPDHVARTIEEIGQEGMNRESGAAWSSFIGEAMDWVDIVREEGAEAIASRWRQLLAGDASPREGFILSLG